MSHESPPRPIRLHRFARSGHCHRVELLMSLLGLPIERVEVDLAGGEQRSPRFRALNPLGQVPVIEDGQRVVADSNAILVYLAAEYGQGRFAAETSALAAEQQRWFSIAAGPLAAGPAAARAHHLFGSPVDLAAAQARARALFELMEAHLAHRPFLVSRSLGLADIANYAYVAHAPEGGISLELYPNLRAWLARVESTPGFIAMPASPIPAA